MGFDEAVTFIIGSFYRFEMHSYHYATIIAYSANFFSAKSTKFKLVNAQDHVSLLSSNELSYDPLDSHVPTSVSFKM